MGFCSGTQIFDDTVSELWGRFTDEDMYRIMKALAVALESHDWDCQSDSGYRGDPIMERVMRELHPGWYEDESKGG